MAEKRQETLRASLKAGIVRPRHLREMFALLASAAGEVTLNSERFRGYASVDELIENEGPASPTSLEFVASNERITVYVLYGALGINANIRGDDELAAEGLRGRIEELLKDAAYPGALRAINHFVVLLAVLMASLLAGAMLTGALLEGRLLDEGFTWWPLLIAIGAYHVVLNRVPTFGARIYLTEASWLREFWERRREDLLMEALRLVLAGGGGFVLGYLRGSGA